MCHFGRKKKKKKKNMYYKTWCVQGAMGKGNNNISIPEKKKISNNIVSNSNMVLAAQNHP